VNFIIFIVSLLNLCEWNLFELPYFYGGLYLTEFISQYFSRLTVYYFSRYLIFMYISVFHCTVLIGHATAMLNINYYYILLLLLLVYNFPLMPGTYP